MANAFPLRRMAGALDTLNQCALPSPSVNGLSAISSSRKNKYPSRSATHYMLEHNHLWTTSPAPRTTPAPSPVTTVRAADDKIKKRLNTLRAAGGPPRRAEKKTTPTFRRASITDLENHSLAEDDAPILLPQIILNGSEEEPPLQRPHWWPEAGTDHIDLNIHDMPHELATLEWWYVNTHIKTDDGRLFSLFASFFRKADDDDVGEMGIPRHLHAITWGMTDVTKKSYSYETLLDPTTTQKTVSLLETSYGNGEIDSLLHRAFALLEVYKKGVVPLPDRLMKQDACVSEHRLELGYDGNRFEKTGDGRYRLTLRSHDEKLGAELTFDPQTPPIRHGDGGVVRSGPRDEGMFYYFMPKCRLEGSIVVDGKVNGVKEASGWYDHEFGRPKTLFKATWTWFSTQLDNGYQITAYDLFDSDDTSKATASYVVVIDPSFKSHTYEEFLLAPVYGATWTSTKTFVEYPIAWELRIPQAQIHLHGEAMDLPTQEYITSISEPAFWEGRVNVKGTFFEAKVVSGLGFVERSGYAKMNTLQDFFQAVSKETLKAIHTLLPLGLVEQDLLHLVGGPSRPHYIVGVGSEELASSVIKPIRDIIDRSGKCWRSYASIAAMDVIDGGLSTHWSQMNLAYPELMHVGSLIIDDIQDSSTIRRGHPTCHKNHGEPIAINAGAACYFLAQLAENSSYSKDIEESDRVKVQKYEIYFETMRAAHVGQALDIRGFQSMMPLVVEQGGWAAEELEKRVLAVHLLKSGAPCASLGRVGALKAGGTQEQVDALGDFYEAIGVAFQIIDDVLNLRGFDGNLKVKGEDIAYGKLTMPIAKAMSKLTQPLRQSLWTTIQSKSLDPITIECVIYQLEECGAVQACVDQARELIETSWRRLDPLMPDSFTKIRLRAFCWYLLDRHH